MTSQRNQQNPADSKLELGSFWLGNPLAEGGEGSVWEGVHAPSDQPVAVKIVPVPAASGRQLAVHHEVRALARLAHPNIIRILDFGSVPQDAGELPAGAVWIAMERAEDSLRRVRRWPEIQDVLEQIQANPLCMRRCLGQNPS